MEEFIALKTSINEAIDELIKKITDIKERKESFEEEKEIIV